MSEQGQLEAIEPAVAEPETPTIRLMFNKQISNKLVAEFLGTYFLVFFGCGSVMVNKVSDGALGHPGIALAFGVVVFVCISTFGHISAAHFNPAVTLAFWWAHKFPVAQVPGYICAQFAGSIAASFSLRVALGPVANLGMTMPSPLVGVGGAFALEFALTFFLMITISSVATDARAHGPHAALVIGGCVCLCALVGGPLTGASMNPARSLAPALAAWSFGSQWLYLVSPVIGAAAGAVIYGGIRCDAPGTTPKDARGCC